jgi:predicted O-methyltransferase YrrM
MTTRRMARAARRVALASARQLSGTDRRRRLSMLARYWVYMGEDRLVSRYLAELWPDIRSTSANVDVGITHAWELPYGERTILDALVRHLRPKRLFEFGTFTGSTTRLLAKASEGDAVIHTIDLPDEKLGHGVPAAMIGRNFLGDQRYRNRMVLHRADTREFNFGSLADQFDFVFIDASHQYDNVVQDSRNALELLAPEGVIVWDDYLATEPGVVLALNELARQLQLVHVASSRLVIHRRPSFPGLLLAGDFP